MKSTFTFPISATTQISVVDVVGYSDQCIANNSGGLNFDDLLSPENSSPSITAEYSDTYLRAQDSSSELVASTKMNDYLIDINIYGYAKIVHLLNARTRLFSERNIIIHLIKPLSKSGSIYDVSNTME